MIRIFEFRLQFLVFWSAKLLCRDDKRCDRDDKRDDIYQFGEFIVKTPALMKCGASGVTYNIN